MLNAASKCDVKIDWQSEAHERHRCDIYVKVHEETNQPVDLHCDHKERERGDRRNDHPKQKTTRVTIKMMIYTRTNTKTHVDAQREKGFTKGGDGPKD